MILVVSSGFAQTQITAKSGKVNVRNIPSTQDTETEKTTVVGSIDDTETYTVEYSEKDASGRLWHKISKGWVAGWLTSVKKISIHGGSSSSSDDSTSYDDNSSSYDDSSYGDSSDGSVDTMDSSTSTDDGVYDDTVGADDTGIDDVAGDDEGNE